MPDVDDLKKELDRIRSWHKPKAFLTILAVLLALGFTLAAILSDATASTKLEQAFQLLLWIQASALFAGYIGSYYAIRVLSAVEAQARRSAGS